MKITLFAIAFVCITISLQAQSVLKGTVVEQGSNTKLQNVFVKDNNNKQLALTDKSGNFEIKTNTGHTLVFSSPGYVSDTLYLVDLEFKKISLTMASIALREVNIRSTKATFDPHKEYPEVYAKSKVYPLSPSSWFGKDARDARKLKKYFSYESEERQVDQVWTRTYVGSIVPLKDQELENFMTLYRPSYNFVKSNGSVSLAVYINDSYKKYEALPPDKRNLPKLTSQ